MSARISYLTQDIDALPSLKTAEQQALEISGGATSTALNCNMMFPNKKKLYKHLRSAIGPGHRALRAIINQTDCHACNREFNKPQALAIHEASSHSFEKEGGNRLEKHAPFFGSRSLPNLTAEDPHQHSHPCEDWAKAFGSLVQNKDTEGLHSLCHMYRAARDEEAPIPQSSATTTLNDQPERAKTDVSEYDD
ncbi:MAG: hypothetical protein Q9172_000293 [Xanthocarpia lactea]